MLIILLFLSNMFLSASENPVDEAAVNKPLTTEATSEAPELSNSQCEALAVTKELQDKYENLKKNIESDYSSGLPNQMKSQLTKIRTEADIINQKIYDLQNSNQEINNIVADTINKLDEFIQILPSISNFAPKIRDRYIVPFANLNSLKAEEEQCLMKMRSQASEEASVNIYQKLTQELQIMSNNLFEAERISPQKYIIYRSELVETLSNYNKNNRLEDAQNLLTIIPKAIHSIQSDIEGLLPGLQLSKNYSSITSL